MPKTLKSSDALEKHVSGLLVGIGEDAQRDGLRETPARVAESLRFLTQGYSEDPAAVISSALFKEENDDMVVVKDIELYSLCEHHLLPFFGKAHVAYIPKGRIVGMSKIARLVDIFARRLQVQERLTKEIASTLQKCLKPRGVAVVIEAAHLCMQMRGVQKQHSAMITSCMLGDFREDLATRTEFLNFIKK